jgi:hypothetical protein
MKQTIKYLLVVSALLQGTNVLAMIAPSPECNKCDAVYTSCITGCKNDPQNKLDRDRLACIEAKCDKPWNECMTKNSCTQPKPPVK